MWFLYIGEIERNRKKKKKTFLFFFRWVGDGSTRGVYSLPPPMYIERIEKLFSSLMMINEFKPGGIEKTSDHPPSLFHALLRIDY